MLLLAIAAHAAATPAPAGEIRTWTDPSGRYSISAEYAGSDDDRLHLKLHNGRIATVPLDQLSAGDQEFVRHMRATRSHQVAAKPAPSAAPAQAAQPAEKSADRQTSLSLFGISIGMTERDVLQALQRKGIRRSDLSINTVDSVMTETGGQRPLKFVHRINYTRSEQVRQANGRRVYTDLVVEFREDLPGRPGRSVCHEIVYGKDYDGAPGPDALHQKMLDDMKSRYGVPTKSSASYALFGDERGRFLKVEGTIITLHDVALEKQLADARESIKRAHSTTAPLVTGPLDY